MKNLVQFLALPEIAFLLGEDLCHITHSWRVVLNHPSGLTTESSTESQGCFAIEWAVEPTDL